MKKTTPISALTKGRPPKEAAEQRVHKVTISFTAAEYRFFKELAGHEPISPGKASLSSARPCRRHGSIAGHIRSMLQRSRAPLTPSQNSYLLQLIEACNTLNTLANQAESAGLLPVSLALTRLLQRMNQLLDAYDRHGAQTSGNHGR